MTGTLSQSVSDAKVDLTHTECHGVASDMIVVTMMTVQNVKHASQDGSGTRSVGRLGTQLGGNKTYKFEINFKFIRRC